jgi:hypothetical protein
VSSGLGTTIVDEQHLRVVPDGTIISWLRIPGDPTSEAVAFVRREVETYADCHGTNPPTLGPTKQRVHVWISPGGWDPQTIASAGVNFPCQVVRWGDVSHELIAGAEVPTLMETLDSGGTWARETALKAAVELFSGEAISWVLPRNGEGPYLQPLLDVAERFEDWLDRDPVADALNATIDGGLVSEEDARRAFVGDSRGLRDFDYADDGTLIEVQGDDDDWADHDTHGDINGGLT